MKTETTLGGWLVHVMRHSDGALSLEEWKAAGRRDRGFAMIDADHDGKVTPDELRAAAAMRGK